MIWFVVIAAFVFGFGAGRAWMGFALRFTLRNSPEVIDEIRAKYKPKGWTQQDEDEMNDRDELLLLMSKNRASRHA